MLKKTTTLCLFLFSLSPLSFALDEPSALSFFNRVQELAQAFDPSVADLYADSATISTRRIFADGSEKNLTMSGSQYKALVRNLMPVAKARGDTNKYSEVTVTTEGNRAKIKADRYSEMKNYTDPEYYVILEQTASGDILVVEEHTMTMEQAQ